jgi:NADH dehydrogenase FAD-containing subunit
MTKLPNKAKVVIIGGGIHGLSTAWKLSETYKNPGDIVVLKKKILQLVQAVLLVVLLEIIIFNQL